MLEWLIITTLSFVVWKLSGKKAEDPVILGIPKAETGQMFWVTKPGGKGWWSDFRGNLTPFIWGFVIGSGTVFFLMV